MTSKKASDTLPPLPPSLKPISSYIQRAEELKSKDPIMAYWCTYYAAQLGLDLKSHEVGARDYLYTLITILEKMKKDLASNDAVVHEAAGAAYVENFALKVFTLADNEDRRGEASRSTAKKFLAAANFLELLRVFEKSNNAEVNEEKVRYAKWKASDIAKAFREGRKPTPGAVGNQTEGAEVPDNLDFFGAEGSATRNTADRSPSNASPLILSPDTSTPNIPPRTPPSTLKQLPGTIDVPLKDVSNSGTWSTVATPGSDSVGPSSMSTKLAFASAMNHWKGRVEPDMSMPASVPEAQENFEGLARGSVAIDPSSRKVHFSPSVVGGLSSTDGSPPPSPGFDQPQPPNSTSFFSQVQNVTGPGASPLSRLDPTMAPLPDSSPSGSSRTSLEGSPPTGTSKRIGRPRSGSSPPANLVPTSNGSSPGAGGATRNSPPGYKRLSLQPSTPPPPPVPAAYSGIREKRASVSSRVSPPGNSNPHLYPSYSPHVSNNGSLQPTSAFKSPTLPGAGKVSGSPDRVPVSGLPPVASSQAMAISYGSSYAPKPPSPPIRYAPAPVAHQPVELTPTLIAQAQKHCRYAISSLEYEDTEQARKELRAALALLGEQ